MIRPARLSDIPALLAIEQRCFASDRLSRRQFRYLLTKGKAHTLVFDEGEGILGYVLLLFSRGTSMARLYSIAVDDEARGRRVGRQLVEAAEAEARERDCAYLRLEIRKDNQASIRLFESLEYRRFGEYGDYYEDHMDAWRYEKSLAPHLRPDMVRVPFYEQTLDFTCGPSSLMMAMKALDASMAMDRRLELRLWREATTIFMTAGHGGCGPFGLALSAAHRGFGVELTLSDERMPLLDSVRSEEKKEVMRLVQEDMLDELRERCVPLRYGTLSAADLRARFEAGGIPVVLISSYQIYGEKFPHWVVVTGFDDHFIYVHDPFVDYDNGETPTDSINMPILQRDFERMARYGKAGLKAVLVVYPRS
ncbi:MULTISPECIES: GNAT family N-acetyltransferase/peptidase C39 family protein [Ectothiorhodospira]|uniref:GNAT family N-acetyltransferase/peptidase C39 family protein n=1 Tax=Ectothiorhodospira TaxID=1051 RepID=UPI00024A8781|nr:GNAT family N-acetyltransferase/peptidase C39 family protein [Ectothiorhodospira sp. PHS-1]EHQ52367.1 GCN5-like N-acetyltransferase [Ectothiorhodospira sp. PHS-1]MCG5513344.1 GNAT family N-acetyltransferase/peptidase C39 family protein [Ectothiorhodospira shaposhnikovii]